jgi:predicted SnoaL-like aldol condensation-catalyzing enzyme
MTNKELLRNFYLSDGIRNVNVLDEILHDEVILHWDSSEGKLILEKEGILNLAKELNQNYAKSIIEITHILEEGDLVALRYSHKVAAIENPSELMDIAKIIVIWEFLENKLIKGHQISQPA